MSGGRDRWKASRRRRVEVKQGWAQLKKETQPTTCSIPIVITKLSAEKSYLHPLRSKGILGGNLDIRGNPTGAQISAEQK